MALNSSTLAEAYFGDAPNVLGQHRKVFVTEKQLANCSRNWQADCIGFQEA
jgi:hypothetical protein